MGYGTVADVLARFIETISGADGTVYTVQACGAATTDGLWEAWVEFIPVGGGTPIRTPRETTQPNRVDAEYWAGGLTMTYLEGALARAQRRPVVMTAAPAMPAFETPAPDYLIKDASALRNEAVLDPFAGFENGEVRLRQELGALSSWHLARIIEVYGLSREPESLLSRQPRSVLVELIVTGVRRQAFAK